MVSNTCDKINGGPHRHIYGILMLVGPPVPDDLSIFSQNLDYGDNIKRKKNRSKRWGKKDGGRRCFLFYFLFFFFFCYAQRLAPATHAEYIIMRRSIFETGVTWNFIVTESAFNVDSELARDVCTYLPTYQEHRQTAPGQPVNQQVNLVWEFLVLDNDDTAARALIIVILYFVRECQPLYSN